MSPSKWSKLAVRDEDGGEGPILVMTHVQQFDALVFSRQALERQLDVRETLEFDLEPQTSFEPSGLLDLSGGVGGTSTLLKLAQQGSAMLCPFLFRDRNTLPSTSRAAVFLCLGDTLKNEVPMSTRVCLRHLRFPTPPPIPLAWSTSQQGACARRVHGPKFLRKDSVTIVDQRVLESLVGRARYLGITQAPEPVPPRPPTGTPLTTDPASRLFRRSAMCEMSGNS